MSDNKVVCCACKLFAAIDGGVHCVACNQDKLEMQSQLTEWILKYEDTFGTTFYRNDVISKTDEQSFQSQQMVDDYIEVDESDFLEVSAEEKGTEKKLELDLDEEDATTMSEPILPPPLETVDPKTPTINASNNSRIADIERVQKLIDDVMQRCEK